MFVNTTHANSRVRDCKTFQNGYNTRTLKTVFFRCYTTTKMFRRRSSTQKLGLQVSLPLAFFSNRIFEKMCKTDTHIQIDCYNPPPTLGLMILLWLHTCTCTVCMLMSMFSTIYMYIHVHVNMNMYCMSVVSTCKIH